jgi:hypothetical protein
MPFLSLRCAAEVAADAASHARGNDPWPAVAHLQIKCSKHKTVCRCFVREANVSVVICGWDRSKWTCWTLSNTHSDPTIRDEEEPDDGDPQEDFNGTDGNGPEEGIFINASEPVWDARAYWLRVVDLRMRIIYKEWKGLVMNTEVQVKAWMRAWVRMVSNACDYAH